MHRDRGRRLAHLFRPEPAARAQLRRHHRRVPVVGDQPRARRHQLADRRLRAQPRSPGSTERLPIAAGFDTVFDADWVTISHDGRFVAYNRGASFLYDRFNGTTQTVSAASPAVRRRRRRSRASAPSGRYVAFLTAANFDPADTNSFVDVYRFDRITGDAVLVSRRPPPSVPRCRIRPPISGRRQARRLRVLGGDQPRRRRPNGRVDVFVRNMETGDTTRLSTNVDAQPTRSRHATCSSAPMATM